MARRVGMLLTRLKRMRIHPAGKEQATRKWDIFPHDRQYPPSSRGFNSGEGTSADSSKCVENIKSALLAAEPGEWEDCWLWEVIIRSASHCQATGARWNPIRVSSLS